MGLLWKHIDEVYLDWMRVNFESRIPRTNYGDDQYKPFFGSLFEIGDLLYVTQVSSPKERHIGLKNSRDFFKIYHPKNNILLSVVNLNFMFPVHKLFVKDLEYKDIEQYRSFTDKKEKSKYINLLRIEMQEINKLGLEAASQALYKFKYDKPDDRVSIRCFDFKKLERGSFEYINYLKSVY